MMNYKDYPIGTKVPWTTETGETLTVVEIKGNKPLCTHCYFSDTERAKRGFARFSCYVHMMACTPFYRKDKKHVIFKSINDELL